MNDTTEPLSDKDRVERELIAMRQVAKVLMGLNPDARRRVFAWLNDYYSIGGEKPTDLFFGPIGQPTPIEDSDERDPD